MDKEKSALENLKNSMNGYVTDTIESFETYPGYLNEYRVEKNRQCFRIYKNKERGIK